MLELRPNCENCDCDLPPHTESYICSCECKSTDKRQR
ncbi:hypothetical protein B4923_03710 [Brenneria roseae subsp. americana]|uniref:DUF1272 domain-containing protein n=1 Tax=Brenneria roseae subsp. americana TaxID=1508507 RepID=A0A2U1U0J0_9GAMM|nr:hypothetical protein B4923_03710 [Brenneria roseae subsp. americana]